MTRKVDQYADPKRDQIQTVISEILEDAVGAIQHEFGDGYAMKNPHLVSVVATLVAGIRNELG